MSSIPPPSCDVLWTPDVIVNVVYRGVMIAVIAALVWERYHRPGRIVDEEQGIGSTTGSNLQPQPKPNKTDTTAEEAANPKHIGIIENRDKVHAKAEKSVNTRHTHPEKGRKLDMIATTADVMNSFGEVAITL